VVFFYNAEEVAATKWKMTFISRVGWQ